MAGNRLDGWKMIAAHFGRDRTTVMRWAQHSGMPVHRLPGSKSGSVFAFRDELERWTTSQTEIDQDVVQNIPASVEPEKRSGFPRQMLLILIGFALVTGAVIWWSMTALRGPAHSSGTGLPSDPAVSAVYLQARDEWAQRTPKALEKAIRDFEEVTRRAPTFAPAWSGLADAYLLSCEFGSLGEKEGYAKAKAAADNALRLDSNLAAAYRARGFILYWGEGRPKSAGEAMRRALELSPRDAQTHFWYGNILVDNGQHLSGLRELNAARMIEPGSVAIQADYAWAQWSAGYDADARRALTQLLQTHPNFANLYDYLGVMKLAEGDYVGYVQDLNEQARLTEDADMIAHAKALQADLKVGAVAVQSRLMRKAMAEIEAGTRTTHAWPVFLASVAQDRQAVVDLLKRADARDEFWGSAGRNARVARLWVDDPEITALLRRRKTETAD